MPDLRGFALATLLLAPAALAAQAPSPAAGASSAIAALHPGSWRVRMLEGSAEPVQDICIADPRLLFQIRHGAAACERFVVADEARVATISYTCAGAGSGRTTLRHAERGAVRIDSQGIADNAPFAFVAEANRTGECTAAAGKAAPAPAHSPAAAGGGR